MNHSHPSKSRYTCSSDFLPEKNASGATETFAPNKQVRPITLAHLEAEAAGNTCVLLSVWKDKYSDLENRYRTMSVIAKLRRLGGRVFVFSASGNPAVFGKDENPAVREWVFATLPCEKEFAEKIAGQFDVSCVLYTEKTAPTFDASKTTEPPRLFEPVNKMTPIQKYGDYSSHWLAIMEQKERLAVELSPTEIMGRDAEFHDTAFFCIDQAKEVLYQESDRAARQTWLLAKLALLSLRFEVYQLQDAEKNTNLCWYLADLHDTGTLAGHLADCATALNVPPIHLLTQNDVLKLGAGKTLALKKADVYERHSGYARMKYHRGLEKIVGKMPPNNL